MTNAIVIYQSPEEVRNDLAAMRSQVEEVLPARVDPDRFLRVVAKAVIGNPKLMSCTRLSLMAAVHEAAQLGLEPSGLLGSAYLVPYNETVTYVNERGATVKQKVMQAHLIPGYRGLIDLARRSGEIEDIMAEVVRARDVFDYEPPRQPSPIIHRPFIPDPTAAPEERDRGPILGAYMVATLRGGFRHPAWMTYDEIESVRRSSKAADDGPWVTHWSEMARKTVVRNGSKYLPLTTEFRRALELDEEAERMAEPPPSPKVSRAAQMLLDRASAATGQPSGEPVYEASPDTIPEESEPPGPPEEPTDEAPATATVICGVTHPELGTCTRMPDHTAGHRSSEGAWPRGQK